MFTVGFDMPCILGHATPLPNVSFRFYFTFPDRRPSEQSGSKCASCVGGWLLRVKTWTVTLMRLSPQVINICPLASATDDAYVCGVCMSVHTYTQAYLPV